MTRSRLIDGALFHRDRDTRDLRRRSDQGDRRRRCTELGLLFAIPIGPFASVALRGLDREAPLSEVPADKAADAVILPVGSLGRE